MDSARLRQQVLLDHLRPIAGEGAGDLVCVLDFSLSLSRFSSGEFSSHNQFFQVSSVCSAGDSAAYARTGSFLDDVVIVR